MSRRDSEQPLWATPVQEGDKGKIARLKARYHLLRELITDLRVTMPERDPAAHAMAPPAEVYLAALEIETRGKSLQEMGLFVDEQLLHALSNYAPGDPRQQRLKELYRQGVQAIIPQAIAKIIRGESFEELMAFLAAERMALAETACDVPSHKFGLARGGAEPSLARTLYTVGGRFDAYREAMIALVPPGSKDFVLSSSFDTLIGQEGVSELRGRNIWASINGCDVPLSTLLVCDTPPANPEMAWLFTEFVDKPVIPPCAALIHADAAYIPAIRSFCAERYGEIVSGAHSEEKLVGLVSALQWHLSHAMLYFRGSAAIAEWLCQALFQVKGYSVTWTIQPDLQALLKPDVADFVASYRDFSKVVVG